MDKVYWRQTPHVACSPCTLLVSQQALAKSTNHTHTHTYTQRIQGHSTVCSHYYTNKFYEFSVASYILHCRT